MAIAYIANEFPSPLEPYVMDEIGELRDRGVNVVCCSGKRVSPRYLQPAENNFWEQTHFFQPLSDQELMQALRRLAGNRHKLWQILRPLLSERDTSPYRRLRTLAHTVMGAALAEKLEPLDVTHIHSHHGYFASWMALTAARLLDIGFSFTLHGSDLLQRADLLQAKLQACLFCVTISEFNREYILNKYPSVRSEQIVVERLGVDHATIERVRPRPNSEDPPNPNNGSFRILSVGRLHTVKNHRFLLQACSSLREQGLDFLCLIIGEGPERIALENLITSLHLEGRVLLLGHKPHKELFSYYRDSDLVVMTSKSEGIPVVLMEAMAHQKLVLAPSITGIPELVEHARTGFLYQSGSLPDFISAIAWIYEHQTSLAGVQRAAAASVAASYDRRRNLSSFADKFLARISPLEAHRAHPLLQQVRLPI
jgi:colanic acid/amylovoran biosynthesis glycosyltransferase